MNTIWVLTLSFLAVVAECAAGRFGILMPAFVALAFYLAVTYGPWRVILPTVILGVVLDGAMGRALPITSLGVLAALAGANAWQRYGDCRSALLQALPGLIIGLAWGLALLVSLRLTMMPLTWRSVLGGILLVLESGVLAALLLPLLVAVLDSLGHSMRLRQYSDSQRRDRRRWVP